MSSYAVCLYGMEVKFCRCTHLSGVPDSSCLLASMARLGSYWSCQPPKNVISVFVTIFGHPFVTFSAILEGSEPFLVQAGIHSSGNDLKRLIWETLSARGCVVPETYLFLSLFYVDHSDDRSLRKRWLKLGPLTELTEITPNLKENSLQVKFMGGPHLALLAAVEGEEKHTFEVVTRFNLRVGLFKRDLLATIGPGLSRTGVEVLNIRGGVIPWANAGGIGEAPAPGGAFCLRVLAFRASPFTVELDRAPSQARPASPHSGRASQGEPPPGDPLCKRRRFHRLRYM